MKFKTSPICSTMFFLGVFCIPMANAGNIVKCTDPKTGKVTFTDKGCKIDQKTATTRMSKKVEKKEQVHHYKVGEIPSLTKQAGSSCADQYIDQFRSENPKLRIKPDIDFSAILERSINRDAVHIILEGTAKYENKDKLINTDLKCTASKRSSDKKWQIVLKNTGQFATAIVKKKKNSEQISEEQQRELGSLWK